MLFIIRWTGKPLQEVNIGLENKQFREWAGWGLCMPDQGSKAWGTFRAGISVYVGRTSRRPMRREENGRIGCNQGREVTGAKSKRWWCLEDWNKILSARGSHRRTLKRGALWPNMAINKILLQSGKWTDGAWRHQGGQRRDHAVILGGMLVAWREWQRWVPESAAHHFLSSAKHFQIKPITYRSWCVMAQKNQLLNFQECYKPIVTTAIMKN